MQKVIHPKEKMSDVNEESVDNLRSMYEDLCRELNMDRETEEKSWNKFKEVYQRSSLEGDPNHWFCCALYAECRASYTPTVGESSAIVMGNCVSLNKLLRSCNMSIYDFIIKIKSWHEMANLSSKFLEQIERSERTFGITFHLYQRFNSVYELLFISPRNEKKNTKYRSAAKCSSNKLYDICWCLYLCAKNENPSYTVDLVTSFHLLICCFDLIYVNVLAENRIDLINPDFEGVPEKWNTPDFNVSSVTSYCIIEILCRLTQALPADAKAMKENSWKSIIKQFFRTNTLNGNDETFLGIVSNSNFERNVKSLNSAYEQFILSVGEFDERILLNNPNYRKTNNIGTTDDGKAEHHQEIKSLIPDTPYTRKHSLPTREAFSEPVANATHNVKKLQDIAHILEPSDFIRQAGDDALNKITEKICRMSNIFISNFPNNAEMTKRFQLAKSLYFYLLEKIIRDEIKTKPHIDLKVLLATDTFNTTLIACCVEIVLAAYNSTLKFPWILNCLNINAFHFYKIIEIVVRSHDGILTRALIKHLNYIEETCLESLTWQKSSPLWEINGIIPGSLPTWSEVDVGNITKRKEPQLQSPMNSAYETFSSTVVSDSARRDLFNTAKETSVSDKSLGITKKQVDGNKRAGSLPIFYRKFYKLAWIRMKELCHELDMSEESSLNKIWTLFEYSITQKTELMKDRHLDQILMCAIYLYIKVVEVKDKSFADIMKFYRKQPQSTSSIYREVLLDNENEETPKNGDIIIFYNTIYVPQMTPYAYNFSEKKKSQHDLLLSPHPPEKQSCPRKLSHNHYVYVSPMEKNEVSHSPNQLSLPFRSPAKDLEKINEIVRGKRNLPFNDDSSVIARKISRKTPFHFNTIRGIIEDRKEELK